MNQPDRLSGVVWVCAAAAVCTASLGLGLGVLHNPGPGFIPFWAGLLSACLAGLLLGVALIRKTASAGIADLWKGLHWGNNIIVVAALLAYCLAMPRLGYLLATFGLMCILFGLGRMKPWGILMGSLLTALLSYGLFAHFLKSPLPRGILGF